MLQLSSETLNKIVLVTKSDLNLTRVQYTQYVKRIVNNYWIMDINIRIITLLMLIVPVKDATLFLSPSNFNELPLQSK